MAFLGVVFALATAVLGFFTAELTQGKQLAQNTADASGASLSSIETAYSKLQRQNSDLRSQLNASSSTPTTPSANTTALTSLTPVSGAFQSTDTSPALGGKPQRQAIVQDLGCTASGDTQYNLAVGYSTFSAMVGLDDSSPDAKVDPTVEVDGDGRQLGTFTPTLGHPAQITLDVTGVLRMDIKWSYQRPVTYPIPITCTPNAFLVVGSGQLGSVSGH
jgi:hypothetical protein